MVDENKGTAQASTEADGKAVDQSTADKLYGNKPADEGKEGDEGAGAGSEADAQAAADKKAADEKKAADDKKASDDAAAKAKEKEKKLTPDELHDAAIAATEAWQANPTDEKLKQAAKDAVQKAKDAAAANKKVVPEKYDLKLPTDSKLKADHLEKIAALAKERGLSNEEAQAIVDRDSVLRDEFAQQQVEEVDALAEQWAKDAAVDPEFGGKEFEKNAELAKRVFKKFGSEKFLKALNTSGLGNNPELIRFGVTIGKAMSEDTFIAPGSQGGGNQQSIADRLYGDQKKS